MATRRCRNRSDDLPHGGGWWWWWWWNRDMHKLKCPWNHRYYIRQKALANSLNLKHSPLTHSLTQTHKHTNTHTQKIQCRWKDKWSTWLVKIWKIAIVV
jgi:hypothetical protein